MKEQDTCRCSNIRVKVFKNGPSKICGRQPSKSFTWSILEYINPCVTHEVMSRTLSDGYDGAFLQKRNYKFKSAITGSKLTIETPLSISTKSSIIELTLLWCLYC